MRADAWATHDRAWRDPAQVVAHWSDAGHVYQRVFWERTKGDWWGLLDELGITLIVTREYEHLVTALSVNDGQPLRTYLGVPHPSGAAASPDGRLFLASTRNPNQVFELAPGSGGHAMSDVPRRPLVPVATRFYPGRFYLHDLAFIGGILHANAVGLNAIVRDDGSGHLEPVWWPRCIERDGAPDFATNYLQLNSIAAGRNLAESFFTASTDRPSRRRPGHLNFPVDRRGVVFSGASRETVLRGLTRPHSARLHAGKLWVDDSGYGRVGTVGDGSFDPVCSLPGWTRGLGFAGEFAFVGTSRVIPRYRHYAPGLDVDRSVCGLHAIDTRSGLLRASITWPAGNQIFAVEPIERTVGDGLPFIAGDRGRGARARRLFYSFTPDVS